MIRLVRRENKVFDVASKTWNTYRSNNEAKQRTRNQGPGEVRRWENLTKKEREELGV